MLGETKGAVTVAGCHFMVPQVEIVGPSCSVDGSPGKQGTWRPLHVLGLTDTDGQQIEAGECVVG